jgi:hypothetical protein
MSTTHNLEPATARRFVNQLKLLDGKTLQALLSRVEAWKVQADRKHLDLTQRANGGANNLRRAVAAWDEALPALQQAIEAARARLADAPPSEATASAPTTDPTAKDASTPKIEADAKPKAPKVAKKPKAAKPVKPKSLSGLDAAAQVLRQAGEPLNAQDLVKRIIERGLWKTDGKTPAATIYAAMIREIKAKGTASRFQKVDRGRFAAAS